MIYNVYRIHNTQCGYQLIEQKGGETEGVVLEINRVCYCPIFSSNSGRVL